MQSGPTSGWHTSREGATYGPYEWADLVALVRERRIGPDDLVWHAQLPGWIPAWQVPGLVEAPAAAMQPGAAWGTAPVAAWAGAPTGGLAQAQGGRRRRAWIIAAAGTVVVVAAVVGSLFGFGVFKNEPSAAALETNMVSPTVIDVPASEVISEVVSSQGGVLSYGPVQVDVPSGAVANDTTIVVTRLDAPFHAEASEVDDPEAIQAVPISSAYDFGPAGVTFDKPVTVTLPYDPGLGPEEIDPNRIAVAYFDGERWIAAGGTADPSTRTITVELTEFEGSVLEVIAAVAVGTAVLFGVIQWQYGSEGAKSDPLSEKRAKEFITPNDELVLAWTGRALIQNKLTKETKALNDKNLARWMAATAKSGQDSQLVYEDAEGNLLSSEADHTKGSNWQMPAHYFREGTDKGGRLHGDCTDSTNSAVSIFRACGFPAKGVFGYGGGGYNKRSSHVWGEVLIGDQMYILDDEGALHSSTSQDFEVTNYKAVTDKSDPRYLGMYDENGQEAYAPNWYKQFTTTTTTTPGGGVNDINGSWSGYVSSESSFLQELVLTIDIGADGNGTVKCLREIEGEFEATYRDGVLEVMWAGGRLKGSLNEAGHLILNIDSSSFTRYSWILEDYVP